MRCLYALALAAALVVNAMPGNAATDNTDNTKVLSHFTISNVTELLNGLGANVHDTGVEEDGDKYLRFIHQGRKYRVALWACNNSDRCYGMLMLCTFVGGAYPLEDVNAFNNRRALGKASVMVSGDQRVLTSSRYIFSDGGVTRLTVLGELAAFFKVTSLLVEDLQNSNVVAKAPEKVKPVSYKAPAGAGDPLAHAQAPLNIDAGFANELK